MKLTVIKIDDKRKSKVKEMEDTLQMERKK